MSQLQVPAVQDKDFGADASLAADRIIFRMTGNADLAAKPQVEALLGKLHSEALRLSVREVEVDMTDLEFMNSSCFKDFVTWISELQDLVPDRRYQIRFRASSRYHWQRRSLHVLQCFAVDLITVES
jgi:hypothetical protein